MRKLNGLIIIVLITTSCAHNKIRFGSKFKIEKHQNEEVNSKPIQEIEEVDLTEIEEQSNEEADIRTTHSDLISEEVEIPLKEAIDRSERKITKEISDQMINPIQKLPLIKYSDDKDQMKKANSKITFGIFLIVLSIFLIIGIVLSFLLVFVWAGFVIRVFLLSILFLALTSILLVKGIRQVIKGQEMKREILKN